MTASMVVFVATLLYLIATQIAGPFGYLGYVPRDPSTSELAMACLCTLGLAALTPSIWRHPSDCGYAFMVATVAIPAVWVPVFYGPLVAPDAVVLQVVVLMGFALMRAILHGGRRTVPNIGVPPHIFWPAVVVTVASSLLYLSMRVGLTFENLALNDVYEQRSIFSESIDGVGGYLVGWVGGGVLPVIAAYALHLRKRLIVAGCIFSTLTIYALTGYKSYVVALFLLLLTYWLLRRSRSDSMSWYTWLTIAMLGGLVLDVVFGGIVFTSLFTRRALATPGLNTAFYMDFFSSAPGFEWRHGILAIAGESPYDFPPARVIGLRYYGSTNTAANANFIADGLANFGIGGALVASSVVGIYLRAYDVLSKRLPLWVSASALMFPLVAFSSTAVLTVLLTHGAAVAALTAWLASGQDGRIESLAFGSGRRAGASHISKGAQPS